MRVILAENGNRICRRTRGVVFYYCLAPISRHEHQPRPGATRPFTQNSEYGAYPIYYTPLCGFPEEHLDVKYLRDVNAGSGCHVSPLAAALAGEHFQTGKFLRHNGTHFGVRNFSLFSSLVWIF